MGQNYACVLYREVSLFRGSVMGYMSLIEKRPVGIYIIYISMGHNYACVINREASCRYIYNVMY